MPTDAEDVARKRFKSGYIFQLGGWTVSRRASGSPSSPSRLLRQSRLCRMLQPKPCGCVGLSVILIAICMIRQLRMVMNLELMLSKNPLHNSRSIRSMH